MATPHDDTAPPSATDYPSEEELAEVDRLDREATESPVTLGPNAERRLSELGLTLLPRVVRALRAKDAAHTKEIRRWGAALSKFKSEANDAYARGRREAVEDATRYLRGPGHGFGETAYRMAATDIERRESERARGGK
jgi:hypothetical protein